MVKIFSYYILSYKTEAGSICKQGFFYILDFAFLKHNSVFLLFLHFFIHKYLDGFFLLFFLVGLLAYAFVFLLS